MVVAPLSEESNTCDSQFESRCRLLLFEQSRRQLLLYEQKQTGSFQAM